MLIDVCRVTSFKINEYVVVGITKADLNHANYPRNIDIKNKMAVSKRF